MKSDQSGTIRDVAWEQIFPWLMIPRALRLATSIPVLFVATIGVLLMPLGWWGASYLLPEQERRVAMQTIDAPLSSQLSGDASLSIPSPSVLLSPSWRDLHAPMLSAAGSLVNPLCRVLRLGVSWPELACWVLGGVWNLLVWGLLGGIITRMSVMRYGRDEREGLVDACRFVGRRYLAFVGTPLFALSGVVVVLALSIPVGWLLQWDVGVLLASLLWFFVLLGGVISTIFIVGVLLGWPLMWGALSAEEMGDVYEGTQRTFAYAYDRPLHYAFYALVAVVVGSVTYHLVSLFAQCVLYFSFWAVSWGSGTEAFLAGSTGGETAVIGVAIISWLNSLVLAVAEAFRYSFLFTAAGVVYLLVRRDSDRIEFDNVQLASQPTRYGLPPLMTDAAGVPGIDE